MIAARSIFLLTCALLGLAFQSCGADQSQTSGLIALIEDNHRSFVPAGPGPFTAVLVVPGCSGIARQSATEEAALSQLTADDRLFRDHYPRFAERLGNLGIAVFLVDILTAEGRVTACKDPVAAARIAEYIDGCAIRSWPSLRSKIWLRCASTRARGTGLTLRQHLPG